MQVNAGKDRGTQHTPAPWTDRLPRPCNLPNSTRIHCSMHPCARPECARAHKIAAKMEPPAASGSAQSLRPLPVNVEAGRGNPAVGRGAQRAPGVDHGVPPDNVLTQFLLFFHRLPPRACSSRQCRGRVFWTTAMITPGSREQTTMNPAGGRGEDEKAARAAHRPTPTTLAQMRTTRSGNDSGMLPSCLLPSSPSPPPAPRSTNNSCPLAPPSPSLVPARRSEQPTERKK